MDDVADRHHLLAEREGEHDPLVLDLTQLDPQMADERGVLEELGDQLGAAHRRKVSRPSQAEGPASIGLRHRHRGDCKLQGSDRGPARGGAQAHPRSGRPLDDEQLNRTFSPLLSPLAWDLGHIANFEELWLVQTIGGREPLRGELGRFYDAIENPRKTRGELPILRDDELRSYLADVRARTLDVLDEVEIGADAEDPLLREGFVYEMLLAHELQHNETMLQLLMLVDGYELPASIQPPGPLAAERPEDDRGRGGGVRDRRAGYGLRL